MIFSTQRHGNPRHYRVAASILISILILSTIESHAAEDTKYIGPDIQCAKDMEIQDEEKHKNAMLDCIKRHPTWGLYYLSMSLMHSDKKEYRLAFEWAQDGMKAQEIGNLNDGKDKPEWIGIAVAMQLTAAYAMAENGDTRYWEYASSYADKMGGLFGCKWLQSSKEIRQRDPKLTKYDDALCQEASNFLSQALQKSGNLTRACWIQTKAFIYASDKYKNAKTPEEKNNVLETLFWPGLRGTFDRRGFLNENCGEDIPFKSGITPF